VRCDGDLQLTGYRRESPHIPTMQTDHAPRAGQRSNARSAVCLKSFNCPPIVVGRSVTWLSAVMFADGCTDACGCKLYSTPLWRHARGSFTASYDMGSLAVSLAASIQQNTIRDTWSNLALWVREWVTQTVPTRSWPTHAISSLNRHPACRRDAHYSIFILFVGTAGSWLHCFDSNNFT